MSPAFMFIDLLEDFFVNPPLSELRDSICAGVNDLAEFARHCDYPVFWVRQEFKPDLSDAFLSMRETGTRITIQGTKGSYLLKELVKAPHDYEIVKKRYSAFFETNLKQLLDSLGCDPIILGGVNTHACIRVSAVDAFQMDRHVILATETIASYDEQYHLESMRYLEQAIGKAMSNLQIKATFGHA
jgi:nicotinamidase-related amidase